MTSDQAGCEVGSTGYRREDTAPIESPSTILADLAALSPDVPIDKVLAMRVRVDFFAEKAKAFREMLDNAMIEWINANGPIEFETIRYYVGPVKNTKCRSVKEAIPALLDATGGDMERFCEILSSNAIKHGAARGVLAPEVWDQLFIVEEQQELKEGKPVKRLQKIDSRFVR